MPKRTANFIAGTCLLLSLCLKVTGKEKQENLVENPSFEKGYEAYNGPATETLNIRITDEKAYSGTHSAQLSYNGKSSDHMTKALLCSEKIKVKPSTDYLVSVRVNIPEDITTEDPEKNLRGAHLGIATYDKNGKCLQPEWTLAGGNELRQTKTTGNKWMLMKGSFKTRPDVDSISIRLGLGDTGTVYFDDLEIHQINP